MKRGIVWAVFYLSTKYFVNINVLLFDNQASPSSAQAGIFELVIVSLLRPQVRIESAEIPFEGVSNY